MEEFYSDQNPFIEFSELSIDDLFQYPQRKEENMF